MENITTRSTTPEYVLALLKNLTPREQLRVIVQVLPDLEREWQWSDSKFWQATSLETLAEKQGIKPAENFDSLLGNGWPQDESIDEFIAARNQWRQQSLVQEPKL